MWGPLEVDTEQRTKRDTEGRVTHTDTGAREGMVADVLNGAEPRALRGTGRRCPGPDFRPRSLEPWCSLAMVEGQKSRVKDQGPEQ